MTRIKEIPINDRPVERLINKGVSVLSNDELMAILLKTGTQTESSKDLAIKILSTFESIQEIREINYEKLVSIKGIGQAKAAIVLAAIELGKRMNREVDVINCIKMNHPSILFEYYKEILKDKLQEYFYAVYLDQKKTIIKDKLLFIGTINYSVVHPREIFKESYLLGATGIVVIHNHPSGDVTPSEDDYQTTNKLKEVSDILGIKLIDHIIIGKSKYYSFYENGDI